MTDVRRRARSDLLEFSIAVDCPLTDWQASSLQVERRVTTIVAPRQSGKSRSLAVLGLHRAFRERGHRVLVVSASDDAAKRLLAEAAAVATSSPLLRGSVVDENSGLLTLSNCSELRSVPASERAVRGWSVDTLLIDECAQLPDGFGLAACFPTIAARPDARVVLAGSPADSSGVFYVHHQLAEQGSEHCSTYTWRLDQADWIDRAIVEAARESLPAALFEREYMGRFSAAGELEVVIPAEWVEAAQARSLQPSGPVVFAVDVARKGADQSVAVSVRGGVARVEWSIHGADLMQVTGRVAALINSEHAPAWIDATGIGAGVYDRLIELGLHAVAFVAAGRASRPDRFLNLRAESWWHAREVFRAGAVDLDPADRTLAGQLSSVRYKLTSSGQIQIQSKDEMSKSPDHADALVIGLWASRQAGVLGGIARMLREAGSQPVHPLMVGAEGRAVRGGWRERLRAAEGGPWPEGSAPEPSTDLTGDLLNKEC
jgi:hypothetical protein